MYCPPRGPTSQKRRSGKLPRDAVITPTVLRVDRPHT